ncbi:hypothetical protein CDAR_366981 [Caerostris darwini]|uniref:Ycf15 n=1 Tax=Caerostris darwini TaxID=1538125 RepID=A0AAV4WKM5_9ARAC|nr:hypothetical protein CDAR_366981 [Caerostris darwini]
MSMSPPDCRCYHRFSKSSGRHSSFEPEISRIELVWHLNTSKGIRLSMQDNRRVNSFFEGVLPPVRIGPDLWLFHHDKCSHFKNSPQVKHNFC